MTDIEFSLDEKFKTLQQAGKCGELMTTGRRCTNSITEWFDLDPDRPFPLGERVGACGMHVQNVAARIGSFVKRRFARHQNEYEHNEVHRIARTLNAVGFKIRISRYEDAITFRNPAEFLQGLDRLGLTEQLGIDLNAPQCGAVYPFRNYVKCDLIAEHSGEHDDLDGTQWRDPVKTPDEPNSESGS